MLASPQADDLPEESTDAEQITILITLAIAPMVHQVGSST